MWYNNVSDFLKNTYGKKVYKLALDAGCTCPNRDGKCGTGGCIFCSSEGSGEFAADRNSSVSEQIAEAKARLEKKLAGREAGYIAYFQAFTNTYGNVEELEQKFTEAILEPFVEILSIATRPDCLGEDVLQMLERLNMIKPVWVELGLQTIHGETAKYIRRGYDLLVYDEAVKKLTARGITVITHVILGLPGESFNQMLETVRYVGNSGVQGIKLQLLHVLKGTDLAKDYEAGKFKTLDMDFYIDLLEHCVRVLPENVVIHRLTGDGPKKNLIAPMWSGNKRMVMNKIRAEFIRRNVVQGTLSE